jgi:hypothetical protein
MARTVLPGQLEHFVAYAGSTAIGVAAYGLRGGGFLIIGRFGQTRICSIFRPAGIRRSVGEALSAFSGVAAGWRDPE